MSVTRVTLSLYIPFLQKPKHINIHVSYKCQVSTTHTLTPNIFSHTKHTQLQKMSGVSSQLNQFHCKSLCITSQFTSKPSLFYPNSVNFALTIPKHNASILARKSVRVRAESEFAAAPAGTATEEPPTEIEVLKKKLVESFYGTNRGLSATSETRAEIVEMITQLEAKNPTPAPTEALSLLDGKWILS